MINFLSGGLMGDFIHQLFVCKNICERDGEQANLLLGGGDPFRFGKETAYADLYDLVISQPYINSFNIYKWGTIDYNLNTWRTNTMLNRHATGKYGKCWSELLMDAYAFTIESDYRWLTIPRIPKDMILVHRSNKRHNADSDIMKALFTLGFGNILFITCDEEEYNNFEFKDKCRLLLVRTVNQMAVEINACRLFIGNQSMPFALASALDVPRVCELDYDAAPFYMGEEKYSKNISWMLNDNIKYETYL